LNSAASETDKENAPPIILKRRKFFVKDIPYLGSCMSRNRVRLQSDLQGMKHGAQKSNVYFAQDAWWIDGGRISNPHNASDSEVYFLLAIAPISIIVIAIFLGEKKRRSKTRNV